MRVSTVACRTLEGVDVECTHCGVRMTSHVGSGGQVRYFHCPGCQRWSTSVYTEVFKADTKLRTRRPRGEEPLAAFGSVRERLSRWLESLGGEDDPWRVLGCSPTESEERIRERYLSLARQHHPDAGGSVDKMQQLNRAYEAVLGEREARKARSLPAGVPAMP
jgi:hypothetical protein